ncbi:MAG: hypothetical protein HONDAALG_02627 [Gammaproteobacteria bacterium]|nr:hypothetical protein [Gammaproteobacteria bacterium]
MSGSSFDDRYLKDAERKARLAGQISEGSVLDQEAASAVKLKDDEHEQQLVTAARGGDGNAFAQLVARHWNRVCMLCYRFVWNMDEAERLAGEACDKVWAARKRLDPERHFGAYLAKTAENHCKSWLRQEKRRGALAWSQMDSTDEVTEDEDGGVSLLIEGTADPTAVDPSIYVPLKIAVERTLKRLPEIQRYVLWLRYVFGYSRSEVASMEGCTEQNIGYHERHAKARFSEYFLEEWGEVKS